MSLAKVETLRVAGSDGTPLSVVVRGGGRELPVVTFINGFACPTFYWDAILERLDGRACLVTWDLKGHGESEAALSEAGASIEGLAADLGLVLDAVAARGLAPASKAAVLAFSVGCQVALEAHRLLADRISGQGLLFGTFERPFRKLVHPLFGRGVEALLHRIDARGAKAMLQASSRAAKTRRGHAISRLAAFVGPGANRAIMAPFYDHLARIDPRSALWIARSAAAHSAGDLLPQIAVPTLVIAGGRDRFAPPGVGRAMADTIPHAEWNFFPRATHTGLLDFADPIAARVLAFLDAHALLG